MDSPSGTIYRSCDCRISSANQPSDAARYIRIGYKSAILLFTFLILLWIMFKVHSSNEIRSNAMLNQVVLITTCLLLNCVAFIIYYGVDTPTPYFAIVLWFTELLPILSLLFLLARPGLRLLAKQLRRRTLHVTRYVGGERLSCIVERGKGRGREIGVVCGVLLN